MTPENLEKIKEVILEFFRKTGLEIEKVEIKESQDPAVSVNLKVEEPQSLIGERGQTLAEIQRLLKIILQKKAAPGELFYINLDINDYKKNKEEYLRELAASAADEVSITKREKQLFPMSAFERRIVHVELASRSDIETESAGHEPERKVIIKPRPL